MRKNLLILISLLFLFTACEHERVKNNRKTYMKFLTEMSDAPEFLNIISEKVNDDDKSRIYFIVEFETKYCGRTLKDKVKIQFLTDFIDEIDGVPPLTYKTNYLINILKQ